MEQLPKDTGAEQPLEGEGRKNFDRNFGPEQTRLANERAAAAKAKRLEALKKAREEAGVFIKDPQGAIQKEDAERRKWLGLE